MSLDNSNGRTLRDATLLWFHLANAYKKNWLATNELLKQNDFSNAKMDVISRLAENKMLSQQELAKKLLVTKGNITQILQKLEKQNIIIRKKNWKTNMVSLTRKGTLIYENLYPKLTGLQVEQFNCLTFEERKQLIFLLKKIETK